MADLDFMYKDDMRGMPSGNDSMNDAFGSAGASAGGPLESPETDFKGRSMSPAALGDPANALPSASGSRTPPSGSDFDCLADKGQ
jgi:hypothetical protein